MAASDAPPREDAAAPVVTASDVASYLLKRGNIASAFEYYQDLIDATSRAPGGDGDDDDDDAPTTKRKRRVATSATRRRRAAATNMTPTRRRTRRLTADLLTRATLETTRAGRGGTRHPTPCDAL